MSRNVPEVKNLLERIDQKIIHEKRLEMVETIEYEIEVVTTYFGGGATVGENDASMLIRAASVRGHLRFWWRFLYGRTFSDPRQMFEAESKIFGNASNENGKTRPSALTVSVEGVKGSKNGKIEFCAKDLSKDYDQHYALFSVDNDRKTKLVFGPFRFTLRLSLPRGDENGKKPSGMEQVCDALRFWVNFGGIGARTRRGCGSLYCSELSGLEKLVSNRWKLDSLFYRILLKNGGKLDATPELAWKESLRVYRRFRQNRNPGQGSHPGRSRWTEPDVLRQLANGHNISNKHRIPINSVTAPLFPRILFGGPIVFHSFQEKALNKKVSPIYQGKAMDRMASPVLTRPIFDRGQWKAGVVVLYSPEQILCRLEGVQVNEDNNEDNEKYDATAIKNPELKKIKALEQCSADNAIDALIFNLQRNNDYKNYWEVDHE